MFAVLYRWKLKPGHEDAFREAWKRMTDAIALRSGTGGSRLHRTADGEFVGYAVWPDRETWERAATLPPADAQAGAQMRDCIEARLETTTLDVVEDLLRDVPR